MLSRSLSLAALSALAIHLAGCDREPERAEPSESASEAVSAATALPPPVEPAPSASPSADAAGADMPDPAALLLSYAQALEARDWPRAARFWARGSGVTAKTLEAAYSRPARLVLEVGAGREEGAAGSLYYEVPVTLRFGDEAPERGTLVLRRANDVPGASAEQRRWHIERSTIGAGQ